MMKGGSGGGGDSPSSSSSSFVPTGFLESLQSQQSSSRFNLLLLEHGEVYFGTSTSASQALPPSLPLSLGSREVSGVYESGGGMVNVCLGWGEIGVLRLLSIGPPRALLVFPLCCGSLMKHSMLCMCRVDRTLAKTNLSSACCSLLHPSLTPPLP